MNGNERSTREYPTPGVSIMVFIVSLILVVIIGSALQWYFLLPGLYVTEWVLILGPPLAFLWRKKVSLKESLSLHFKGSCIFFGILGGVGIHFVMEELFYVMEDVLGPYPSVEFLEKAFPKTWLEFVPWILAIGLSAGICEEVLFRGFIQNGLQKYWGALKAVVVAALLFGVFHLDPWRIPSAIVLGLLAGYLLVRTRSLYTAMILHGTSNTLGQVLAFTGNLPETNVQWFLVLVVSLGLISLVLFAAERTRKVKK